MMHLNAIWINRISLEDFFFYIDSLLLLAFAAIGTTSRTVSNAFYGNYCIINNYFYYFYLDMKCFNKLYEACDIQVLIHSAWHCITQNALDLVTVSVFLVTITRHDLKNNRYVIMIHQKIIWLIFFSFLTFIFFSFLTFVFFPLGLASASGFK